jgi:hypothetical protein
MEQLTLLLHTQQSNHLHARDVRTYLGAIVKQHGLSNLHPLFHRSEGFEQNLNNISLIRWLGGQRGVFGLRFIGAAQVEWAKNNVRDIAQAIAAAYGTIKIESLTEAVDCVVDLLDYTPYKVNAFQICKQRHFHIIKKGTDEEIKAFLAKRITSSIKQQAELIGADARDLHVVVTKFYNERVAPVSEKNDIQGLLLDIDCLISADLKGHWAAGSNINKGNGSIHPIPKRSDK